MSTGKRNRNRQRLLAILLLWLAFALALYALRTLSATYDELIDMGVGQYVWRSGDFSIQQMHYQPPLSYYVNSALLPLLHLPANLNVDASGHFGFWPGRAILYHGTYTPDLPLFLARYPFVLLFMLSGALLWRWGKQLLRRETAATWSLFFFALSPTVLAHGTLAKNDFILAAMFLFTGFAFWQFLRRPRWYGFVATALFCAGGLLSKLTGVALLAIIPAWYLVTWYASRHGAWPVRLSLRRGFVWGVLFLLLVGFFVAAGYGFHGAAAWSPATRPHRLLDRAFFFLPGSARPALYRLAERPIPGYDFVQMLLYQVHHQEVGHDSYLLGRRSLRGWVYYFPIAMAVKTPLVTWLTLVLAFSGFWKAQKEVAQRAGSWLRFAWLWLPIAAVFLPALKVRTDIGIRYLLPFYPYLFLFLGYALLAWQKRHWRKVILAGLTIGYLFTIVRIAPDYLAYFNALAGGPNNGYKILGDSNLDWGQSLKELRSYMDEQDIATVKLAYFGSELPEKRGIRYQPLGCTPTTGVIALSSTFWQGLYLDDPHCYDWLHPLPVRAQVGHAIFIYDLR